MDADTETLLALVASLLQVDATSAQILDALVQCDGNPVATAELLQKNQQKKPSSKRKRDSLDEWLAPSSSSAKREKKPERELSVEVHKPPSSSKLTVTNRKSSSSSNQPPAVDLMSVLKQAPASHPKIQKLPPFTLSIPELVTQHTPCTMHLSVLPPELACQLFHTMIDASRHWQRNKWWLFDRVVESPHRTSFFARKTDGIDDDETWQEAARYWYNGRMTSAPVRFPPEMEEACHIIEKIVNEEMKKRKPYSLEWRDQGKDFVWKANVAASNCYEGGKESVGYHSDQLTYLGPYPTIASLSLGTRRNFNLREVIPTGELSTRKARTFVIPLIHNSLTIMHASCQERFKHSIPPQAAVDLYRPAFPKYPHVEIEPSNCRINITFRFYRPDFRPNSIPLCKCGVPTILRPDMKNRSDGETDRYWWTCYAGAQNEGKGCNYWKVMDMSAEGRGCPTVDSEPVHN